MLFIFSMCFSAAASFTAAAVLVTTGTIALKVNPSPKTRAFAAIPILFGIQQLSEGFVWRGLADGGSIFPQSWAIFAFLFFAWVIWPTWVPWSILRMEDNPRRRKILAAFVGFGLFFATMATYALATGDPYVEIKGQCLDYGFRRHNVDFIPPNLHALIYFSTAVISFFVSSKAWVHRTGYFILSGLVVTLLFWKFAVTSVWCFFAALASLHICLHLYRENSVKLAWQR